MVILNMRELLSNFVYRNFAFRTETKSVKIFVIFRIIAILSDFSYIFDIYSMIPYAKI